MIRHCREKALIGAAINARRLTLTALVIVVSGGSISPQASAKAAAITRSGWGTGGGSDSTNNNGFINLHVGNGKYNRTSSTVLSPTINHGFQQIANTNVSGQTITQTAFCKKKHRICRISQRLGVSR
jgi:hypothetical protein